MDYLDKKQQKNNYTAAFLLILLVPFSNFYIDIGFAFKPFMIFTMVYLLFSMKHFIIHKLNYFEITLIIFFMYFSVTALFAEYPAYSLRLILGAWLTIFCYFIMRYILSKVSIENIEKAISRSGLIFNVTSLVYYLAGLASFGFVFHGNHIRAYGVMMDRNFPRLIGVLSDPNVYAFYNVLFFFYYLTHLEKRFSKVGLFLSITTLLLTLSRGAMIAVVFGILLMFLTASLKQKIKMIFILPIGGIIIGFLSERMLGINFIQYFVERFTAIKTDNGSGRLDLWENGISLFKENPFGIGIFNFQPYNEAIYGKVAFMHNTFLEVLVEGGVLALASYLASFVILVCYLVKNWNVGVDKRYLCYSLFAMIILMTSLSMVVNESLFLIFTLIWRYLLEGDNPKEQSTNRLVSEDNRQLGLKKHKSKVEII
ncbi:O-antigen ligase family protein [Bacillus paranthracis]|uniref:O-antigen ligase family protein n=1 Tax=Bacillus paranthracis TaxID=2026186 RepID=UPI000D6D83C9|nr:O-antigen ligase family protein [Bacillus paranthracis]PWN72709.1 sugar isomerase [Bacillus cereus]MCX3321186.1 O-antigen ligase family protein [Bacillus paranthracis]MEC4620495.1 O-antigen ligase family protein [Bacillus paranthracis]PWN78656.1 sugar isomerase [Bacillus cereus]UHJ50808.1 O-antigen ligase family protein [Bacillus paranthracis]